MTDGKAATWHVMAVLGQTRPRSTADSPLIPRSAAYSAPASRWGTGCSLWVRGHKVQSLYAERARAHERVS